jgi:hypothetical protein
MCRLSSTITSSSGGRLSTEEDNAMVHEDSKGDQVAADLPMVEAAEVDPTRHREAAGAPVEPDVSIAPKSPAGAARQRRGRSKGGQTGRTVALIGLGADLPAITLRTSDDQLRLLEAVAEAVAKGKTSGMVATTLVAVVKAELEQAADRQVVVPRR